MKIMKHFDDKLLMRFPLSYLVHVHALHSMLIRSKKMMFVKGHRGKYRCYFINDSSSNACLSNEAVSIFLHQPNKKPHALPPLWPPRNKNYGNDYIDFFIPVKVGKEILFSL